MTSLAVFAMLIVAVVGECKPADWATNNCSFPYRYQQGLQIWDSPERVQWCCENVWNEYPWGGPGYVQMMAEVTYPPIPIPDPICRLGFGFQQYDCMVRDRLLPWSYSKRTWCCEFPNSGYQNTFRLDCSENAFDCMAGDIGWVEFSPATRSWCCRAHCIGCESTTNTASSSTSGSSTIVTYTTMTSTSTTCTTMTSTSTPEDGILIASGSTNSRFVLMLVFMNF